MIEKENFNQKSPEKIQSVEDFSFEEVELNTEGAIGIFARPEEELEVVKSKVIKELKEKNWWLQDEIKKEGFPKEQFVTADGKYNFYNFNESLSIEQISQLIKGVSFIENYNKNFVLDGITILIRKIQNQINLTLNEPFYGKCENNSLVFIYPRALEPKLYRGIPEVYGLEAVIVHELSHVIKNKISNELSKKWRDFGWEDVTPDNKEKPKNPERCITKYAETDDGEDFCESVVGLYSKSSKLDFEKKIFLEDNIFNQIDVNSQIKIIKKEKVELPKSNTKIKFFRKNPIIIVRNN